MASLAADPLLAAAQDELQNTPPLPSQPPVQDRDENDDGFGVGSGEIIVRAERIRGQLDVEQEPILELNEEDIAAEGVTSIADLVTQITAQTGSARGRGGGGRPVILVNGIRIGSFREFRNYPPEALERVEVFPEEVAQRFGFPPDRRVLNLILKENYRNAEIELEFESPDRGGYFVTEQELGYLQIADGGRINANFTANDTSLLTEDERDIIQTPGSISDVPGDPDQAQFRSLVADNRSFDANLSWAKAIIDSGTSLSANINYFRDDTRTLQGLNTVVLIDPDGNSALRTFGEQTPLEQRSSTDTLSTSGSLTKRVNAFRLTSTFDASFSETEQQIDRLFDTSSLIDDAEAGLLSIDGALPINADAGFDTVRTRNISGSTLSTLRGPVANLPGGEVLATFDIGYDWTRLESSDTRTLDEVALTRGGLSTGVNLTVPITSRRTGFADRLGSFTLNGQIGLNHLSDFGTLGDYTIGLNWGVTERLDLSATYIVREVAPGLTALGNPEVTTFNTPVFDFINGETVLAAVTTGGNPDLLAETQRDWKFAANWELPFVDNTRLTVEYIRNRSDDVTASFPQITPEIELAFSDRITRDADGTLVALDRRPITFAETRADRLQIGLSIRGSIGVGGRGGQSGGSPRRARGGSGGSGGPPQTAQRVAESPPGGRLGGGPPSGERREQFRQFRERLCADDGLAFITRLVRAVENDEDLSSEMRGFEPQRFERILSRMRDANGEISDERLAQFRERFCSREPGGFGARGGPPGGGRPGGPRGDQFAALREKVCGENGLEEIRQLIAAIDRGEDVSEQLPGLDPELIRMMIDRARDDNGNVGPEALEQFRTRLCASGAAGQGGQQARGGPPPGFNPLARGARRGWRYFVSLNHTIELENEILIAPGVPVLDQLDGDGTEAFGFPRNTSRFEAGIFGNGIGMRLSGRYTGETRINGSGLPGSSDIFFDDLLTFDVRLFSEIGQLVGRNEGILKNFRISLRMDNIFDGQRRVRDENGDTPINFQPLLIDPVGRYLGIDLRKLF
ncbi:MAG: hypothetical protein AAF941_05915 [Pseudomonadota bacterium]